MSGGLLPGAWRLAAFVAACAAVWSFLGGAAPARAQEAAAPLVEHGCVGCHSLDGSPQQGPTFQGLMGSHRGVYRAGERISVLVDETFVRRSIEQPDAEIAEGFTPGFMPRYQLEEAELDAIVLALRMVPAEGEPDSGNWVPLVLGLFFFVFGHLALSSSPLRGWVVVRLGAGGFSALYSLVAALSLAAAVWGYTLAPFVVLFDPPTWTRWVPNVIMPLAITLVVLGFTTSSPTVAGMASKASAGPVGIVRITRHPALWGFGLWGLSHLPPNGDLRSALVFVAVAFLAFSGMVHIDIRRAAVGGEDWERFERETSVFPFAAILAGRQRFSLRELGWWKVLLGIVVWAMVLHLHSALYGVSPLP